ncbi:hypothetical protein I5677_02675 [Mobilitalea sibirica]|uniref:DNA mismatch repair proteins mutS family domain-containing protein n=1 Tax=Mobilitalea sibirica TaxID=1462919 RepID=A0A8J7H0U5_9FIRM|nr:hypothetical protein [Mobilitalea sibirica]MBH1939797.1 hypothetical protein [Mobilitalea sibirica]
MHVRLLYEDCENLPRNALLNRSEIIQDLNLDIIFKFMARNDKFIYNTVRSVITNCATDINTVLYRQAILTDCIKNYNCFSEMYEMTSKAFEEIELYKESVKKVSVLKLTNSQNVLFSLEILGILVRNLEKFKMYVDSIETNLTSPGMRAFYDRLISDYNYEFVEKIKSSLGEMNFLIEGGEITFSGTIGQGLKAKDIIVNHLKKLEFRRRKPLSVASIMYYKLFKRSVVLLDDSRISNDVREMEAAGLSHILKMYQNFIKELTTFFENLHYQLSFYVGAANLQNRLTQMNIPTSMPKVVKREMGIFRFRGLYDLSMAIYQRHRPVSNDLDTQDLHLFIITGANQGGKSTYLRSIGIAQILMQSGMFVPAEYYCNCIYDGIFTHFTRREDTAMNSGKLDEELNRISRILDNITPNSMLLLNESFATTTEREGSQIASDVVNALYENGTNVLMVTHLFEFTKAMYEKRPEKSMFLSAERLADGTRTFRIIEKEPERTSYGLDLYKDIIGEYDSNDIAN